MLTLKAHKSQWSLLCIWSGSGWSKEDSEVTVFVCVLFVLIEFVFNAFFLRCCVSFSELFSI